MTQSYESIHANDPSSDDRFLDIPVMQESLETFNYLGLHFEEAQWLWDAWITRDEDPTDFYRYPFDVIYSTCDKNGNSNDDREWIERMRRLFSEEFIAAIMDARFEDLRLTDGLFQWAWDTVLRRWEILEAIIDCSKARTEASHLESQSEATEGKNTLASFVEQDSADVVSRVTDENSSVTLWKATSHPYADSFICSKFSKRKRVDLFADGAVPPDMK
jgi:hypothetical protein